MSFTPATIKLKSPLPHRDKVKQEKWAFAKAMRKHPTKGEQILWNELRMRKLNGLKFTRQRIILGWIADFYCASRFLIVEVDGSSHNDKMQEDKKRDSVMAAHGFYTLRIPNELVLTDIGQAKQTILDAVSQCHVSSTPS
jgi:very-short-patch-repair endonuclease